MAKIETETQARQGAKGKPVLIVLIAGVALMLIALIGLMTWQGSNAPPERASHAQSPSTERPSGSSVPGEPGGNPSNPAPASEKAR